MRVCIPFGSVEPGTGDGMRFSDGQLEQYRTLGYVIVDCPFPESFTEECMAAVEGAARDPTEGPADGSKRNHHRLRPQVEDSYWCALDHSLPFLKIILHPEIVELARQLTGESDIYMRNGGINEQAPDRSIGWHVDGGPELDGVHALFLRRFAEERVSAHRAGQSQGAARLAAGEGGPPQGGARTPRFAGRRRLGGRPPRRGDLPGGETTPADRAPFAALSRDVAQPHDSRAGT